MKKFILLLLGVVCLASVALAQQGAISGTISDQNSGEPLIGATVVIEGTSIGTSTDFDGKYQFSAEPGVYTLVINYLGYNEKKIEEVEIKSNETTYLDFSLTDEAVELDLDVVVTAKVIERSENAVLLLQKKSDKIQDGISSQEISRLGAGNAAAALTKVTGTTVVDGKYVYVRGLGDRYSATLLNGTRLPSIDPYRNSAQLDIIPSNLLDNIIAAKSFTPDLPGDFTGGSVDIKTKSLPERFTYNISLSSAYNTQATGQDNFLTFDAGSKSWLGYNDGTLDLPAVLQEPRIQEVLNRTAPFQAGNNESIASRIDEGVRSLNQQMMPTTKTSPLNYSVSASLGNQFQLGGKPLGVLLTLNYSRDFAHYSNARNANYVYLGGGATNLQENFNLTDDYSVESPQLGGLFGLSFKPSPTNEIRFMTIYSHNTDISTRFLRGPYLDYGVGAPSEFQSRSMYFQERALTDYILSGEHVFGASGGVRLDWSANYITGIQSEPDLRFLANTYNPENDRYSIAASLFNVPGHFYRELEDEYLQGKVDLTIPILQSKNNSNKLKFGGYYNTKDRVFNENIYNYYNRSGSSFNGDGMAYFGDDNIGIIDDEGGRYRIGLYIADESRAQNSYTGTTNIWASYGMLTLQMSDRLKFIGGARVEGTQIMVNSFNEEDNTDIDKTNILPAVHFIYSVSETANLRASYTNTIARPNMREVAPFASFGFIGDPPLFGNPDLNLTRINNFDLRYENFLRAGELFAISGFYKLFKDPIVQTFRIAGNPQFTFKNAANATLLGAEFEFRKSLDFISESLNNLSFSTNIAYIYSVSDLDSLELANVRDVDPNFSDTRPFAGQSPFVINFNLNYVNPESGWDGIIAFNFFDDRLSTTGVQGTPDIYERGRGTLDLSISKKIGRVQLKLRARNLLDPNYDRYSEFLGQEYLYSRYQRGRTISLGLSYGI